MTKKSGFILFILVFLTIGVVWLGQDYQETQKSKLLDINGYAQSDKEVSSTNKKENKEAQKEKFEKNREHLSLLGYLSGISNNDEKKVVSFYGDFSKDQNWLSPVGEYIKEQVGGNVEVTYAAFPDFDSYRLLEEDTVSILAENKPNLVFFQVPVYGDQIRDISLEDSKNYLIQDYEAIKQILPETLVVFVTPNPSSSRQDKYNSRTLLYTSYLDAAVETIKENKLPLFDLHEAYHTELDSNNLTLETTLIDDGKTLNDQGSDIYSTLFNKQLMTPIDTTSGQ